MIHKTSPIFAILALSACGGGVSDLGPGSSGGGTPGGGSGGSNIPTTIEFNNATLEATSDIAGHAVISNANEIRTISADLRHETRALTDFSDGQSSLSDTDGDRQGVWTDGTTTVSPSSVQSGSYDFSAIYNLNNAANGSGPMIVGVITPSGSMPSSGTASFAGEAFVDGTNITTGAISTVGSSAINVNFSAGTVDVTIDGFSTPPSFDEIQMTGMSFDSANNTFSGGTFRLLKNGSTVTSGTLGTSISSDAKGSFFGLNSAETSPDEIGGVFVADGTDGTLSGGYIAD